MDKNWAKSIALLTTIVTTLVGYVGVGTVLGYLLWKKLGAPTVCIVFGSMVGLVLAMVQLVKMSQRAEKDEEKDV